MHSDAFDVLDLARQCSGGDIHRRNGLGLSGARAIAEGRKKGYHAISRRQGLNFGY